MSKFISEILETPRPSLAMKIDELERLSGRPGVDIRLSSELKQIYRQKAAFLGLDENDTSPKELYFAMKNHVFDNTLKFESIIGVDEKDSPKQMVGKVIKFIDKRIGKRSIWAVKPSIARRQLKANPPKKLMKILGIRSMDSALKREGPGVFYCFAKLTEGKSWVSKYASQASKMTASDFDYLKINISILPDTRGKRLKDAGLKLNRVVYSDQESAHIQICLLDKRFKGDSLFVADMLMHHIRVMLQRAEYYKSQGMKAGFTEKMQSIRAHGFGTMEYKGYPFGWEPLMHGTTEHGLTGLISEQETFIASEDLLMPSLAQILNFEFWKHPFGMYHDGGTAISFNLSDMIINAVNDAPFEKSYVNHGRSTLQNELFARYLHHEPVRAKVTEFNFTEA